MSLNPLKTSIAVEQDALCALSGEPLAIDPSLNDPDRITPKAKGGTYTRKNTRVVTPLAHMAHHGILRTRTEALDGLKSLFDDRVQMMKLLLKENNQLQAYKRRIDHQHPETAAFLEAHLQPIEARIALIDKALTAAIKSYPDAFVRAAIAVKGLGPITVAALTAYVDLEKAPTPSSLWQYVGLDRPSHERYEKNPAQQTRRVARGPAFYSVPSRHDDDPQVPTGWGGNKVLRTVLWNSANVMMKLGEGGYRDVYDRTKLRLSVSEKVVKTRNTAGALVECAWKDTKPSHRHGAALRAVMKHLLADYWMVGRTMAGLRTTPLYAEAMLGHAHIIAPKERGWAFEG